MLGTSARPHWPALDGVRAAAVMAVVFVHAGIRVEGGGYGVDVFFALSGFLITGILWNEVQRTGKLDRRRFYWRRALRLLPALFVCCLLTIAVDVAVKRGGGHLEALPFVLGYVANWYVAADGQALGFFGQTWSLAIEEQFYLLWPFVIVALRGHRRPIMWLLGISAAAWVTLLVGQLAVGDRSHLFTTSRVVELAIGGAAAIAMRRGWRPPSAMAWASAVTILVLFVTSLPGAAVSLVGFPLIGAATAILLVHVVTAPNAALAGVLSLRPLVGLGRISYGVYLFHYPILLGMAAQGYSHRVIVAVGIPASLAVACVSWFLVERPANRWKDRSARTLVEVDPAVEVDAGPVKAGDQVLAPVIDADLPPDVVVEAQDSGLRG